MTLEERQSINMTFGPEGTFGYLKGNEDEIMWWSNPASDRELTKEELANFSTEDIQREFFDAFKGWHEPIGTMLKNTSLVVKTNMYDIPTLPVWHKNRVVLIGDAAHAMSPTSGQGASVALEDAMYLTKLLRQSPSQLSKVFTQFEQDRRPRVEKMIAQARRNNKKKKPASPLAAWFRNQMMGVIMSLLGERSLDQMYRYTIEWDDKII